MVCSELSKTPAIVSKLQVRQYRHRGLKVIFPLIEQKFLSDHYVPGFKFFHTYKKANQIGERWDGRVDLDVKKTSFWQNTTSPTYSIGKSVIVLRYALYRSVYLLKIMRFLLMLTLLGI